MKTQNYKLKSGFSLIELLVAVFIFVILFLIAAAFVNLAAGSVKSMRTKMLTTDIRNTMDTISQKMNNANDKTTSVTPPIYGFNVNGSILGTVNAAGNCAFYGRVVDATTGRGWIAVRNTCSWSSLTSSDSKLTGDNVNVTGFTPVASNVITDANKANPPAPYLKITIQAQDADAKYQNDNQITLQTTYTMDYMTIQRLKNL